MKWLRDNNTSPCSNMVLDHQSLLKLRPWQAAISKFIEEDSKRRVTKGSLESAPRQGKDALKSSDPSGVKAAIGRERDCMTSNYLGPPVGGEGEAANTSKIFPASSAGRRNKKHANYCKRKWSFMTHSRDLAFRRPGFCTEC